LAGVIGRSSASEWPAGGYIAPSRAGIVRRVAITFVSACNLLLPVAADVLADMSAGPAQKAGQGAHRLDDAPDDNEDGGKDDEEEADSAADPDADSRQC